MSRRLVPVMLVIALAPSRAWADAKVEAQAHMERAMSLHASSKYTEALSELTIAYSLDPDADVLYAIAQTHVALGQCDMAINFYERFLSTRPQRIAAAAAQEAIDTCKTTIPTPPPSTAEPAPAPAPVPVPAEPQHEGEQPGRWYTDKLGLGLVGGGVALGVIGLVTYSSALGDLEAAESAPTYRDYEDKVDSARSQRTLATVLIVAGVAVTGAGVYRFIKRRKETRSLVIAPTTGGAMVTWQGSF